jgi:hypothetical protein
MVTVSEQLSLRNDQAYEVIGRLKDRFLLFRDRANNDYEIQAFTESLQLSWKKELEFEKKRADVIEVIPNDDFFVLIYRFKNKGRTILKANKYDAGANVIDSSTIFNYGSRFYPPRVQVIESEDRSKILLFGIERQSKIEAMCFDVNLMELLWYNEFSPENLTFDVDYQQPIVSNDGRMYYILDRDNRKSSREDHNFEFYYVDANTPKGKISTFKIPMQENLTFDVRFEFDNLNNNIVAGGLYSEKNRGRANGYFYLSVPTSNSDLHTLTFRTFDDKFVSDFTGKLVKNNKGIVETGVQEIVLRRDGGIILIAERNKHLERQMMSAGRGSYIGEDGRNYIVDYHYEDMVAISIHPNGEHHWDILLPKRQYSQDDSAVYSSFFLLKTPAALRLIFNDEIKQENTVSEYVVRGNGEFDRNSVMSTDYQKLQLRFRDAIQLSSDELLIPSERRSRLRLVKLTY